MGSNIAFAALYVAAMAIQSSVAATAPAPLKPSSPWNVEYADNMCLLTRDFGEGEAKVTLGFKPGPASEYVRVVVVTNDTSAKIVRGDAKLDFDGQSPVEARFVAAGIKEKALRIMAIDLKRPDLAPLPSAKQFHIQADGVDLRLVPTRMSDAMKVLGHCENDLLIDWGMDPAVLATIAQFPRVAREGGGVTYFSSDDYPSDAIRREEQGTAGARIRVGTDGRVTTCDVFESSGSKALDSRTCDIIKTRYRYEPARGHDGKPISSFSFQRIRWELPE